MKPTGITRRIDELGRIVIPKEIRKNMYIKTGELLEIYLLDEDSLVFKKYSTLRKENNILEKFINIVTKEMHLNIFITDFNKIIFSNLNDLKNRDISDSLNDNNKGSSILLTQSYVIKKPYSFYNLNVNGDFIGYIVFEYNVDKINKELENILVSFITNCLENK